MLISELEARVPSSLRFQNMPVKPHLAHVPSGSHILLSPVQVHILGALGWGVGGGACDSSILSQHSDPGRDEILDAVNTEPSCIQKVSTLLGHEIETHPKSSNWVQQGLEEYQERPLYLLEGDHRKEVSQWTFSWALATPKWKPTTMAALLSGSRHRLHGRPSLNACFYLFLQHRGHLTKRDWCQ